MDNNYRHEYKYLISSESALLLKVRLPHIMKRDPHAGSGGQYTIRSLYFDDLSFSAFDEKVSGTDNRTKFRIRCYNYQSDFFRLEKKEKKGHLTRKTSQKISLDDVLQLQNNPRVRCPNAASGLYEELRLLCSTKAALPVVLVDYDRTPFISKYGNTRITIDENLRTIPHCRNILAPAHPTIPILEPDQVILEVKFDDYLPGYLSDCLADIPKNPVAVSKFAMCLNIV